MPEQSTADNIVAALVDAADALAQVLSATPLGSAAQVTRIVLHGAQGVIHELSSDDLQRARESERLHQAAGASANRAAKLAGLQQSIDRILSNSGESLSPAVRESLAMELARRL